MNIALIDVDGHAKKKKWGAKPYPNLALAKLAAWHKQQGDNVEWYTPFSHYDRVYMAKVFNFSPDYNYVINNADEIIRGGTGYDAPTLAGEVTALRLRRIFTMPQRQKY